MTTRTVNVDLDGHLAEVPIVECICYLAEVYTDPSLPYATHKGVTFNQEKAWEFIRKTIANGGHGHVVIWDLTLVNRPKKIRCLGRIDNVHMDPIIP